MARVYACWEIQWRNAWTSALWPGGRGGDEAAAFGHVGLVVKDVDQRPVFEFAGDQYGTANTSLLFAPASG